MQSHGDPARHRGKRGKKPGFGHERDDKVKLPRTEDSEQLHQAHKIAKGRNPTCDGQGYNVRRQCQRLNFGIDTLVEDKGDVGPFGQGDNEFPEEKVNGQGCCRDETDLWSSIRRGRAHSDSTFVAYSSATTSCEMRMTIRPSSLRSLISRNVLCLLSVSSPEMDSSSANTSAP